MDTYDSINLLGAASVAVIDALCEVTDSVVGHRGETAAALVAVGHQAGLSNDGLRQVLGLSHPGTVRVVDRLVEAGLVERRPGPDRRTLALHLTAAGLASRAALLERRQAALEHILLPLDDTERATFAALLAKMLERLPRSALHGLSICRLCDNDHCSACPIETGINGLIPTLDEADSLGDSQAA